MKTQIARLALLGLVAACLAVVPVTVSAQDTNAPAAAPKTVRAPFKGKVTAVDTAAMTLTIGDSEKIYVTSKTKITKDGKPATLSDVTVGDAATGAYKEDANGQKNATSIRVGEKKPKAEKQPTDGAAPPAAPKN
jgi:hypothetical protein